MLIKRSAADAAFSDCIRRASNWSCARCCREFNGKSSGLHCAHIVGRRKSLLRFYPLNALSLCHGCHSYFTANPLCFSDWVAKTIGEPDTALLRRIGNMTVKFKIDEKLVAVHYNRDFARMEEDGYSFNCVNTYPPIAAKIRELELEIKDGARRNQS
jgi:hypothetical protein